MAARIGRQGRPSKVPNKGERLSLGLKVTAEIKQRLDQAARDSGRTQSQEAELRIQQSFEREDDLLAEALKLAYGSEPAAIFMTVVRDMTRTGRIASFLSSSSFEAMDYWTSDPFAYDQAVEAAKQVMEAFRPPGDRGILRNDRAAPAEADSAVQRKQNSALPAVVNPDWPKKGENPELEQWATRVRKLAGPRLLSRLASYEGFRNDWPHPQARE